jgi:DNA-binding NarL/FixJ family response regulator
MKTESHETGIAQVGGLRPIGTLVVDDSPLIRKELCDFLGTQTLLRVLGTAVNGAEALQRAEVLMPDLVLMDMHMPCMNGLQATELLRLRLPGARVIIITAEESVSARSAAREHGAHGFVQKMQLRRDLMTEIRRVFLSK